MRPALEPGPYSLSRDSGSGYDGRGGGRRVGGDIGVCVIIGVLRLSVIKDEMLLL